MRQAENIADSDFAILCTGELNKNKDQATLIKAASQLQSKIPNLKILLAGNGPLESDLRSLVTSLGLDHIVRFLGYRTDLEKVVPAVDVVVSCSHREGMPLNIIEAMLCGKPVVAAVNRGSKELITNQENGLLFQAGNVSELADHILVLQDPRFREQMGRCGKKKAAVYTIESVKNELRPQLILK